MGIDIALERKQRRGTIISSPMEKNLDCHACGKTGSMMATTVNRFLEGLRFLGTLIIIPSVLGCIIAIGVASNVAIKYFSGDLGDMGQMLPWYVIFGALSLAAAALVSGTLGYFLLSKKSVFHCQSCGYILERS